MAFFGSQLSTSVVIRSTPGDGVRLGVIYSTGYLLGQTVSRYVFWHFQCIMG